MVMRSQHRLVIYRLVTENPAMDAADKEIKNRRNQLRKWIADNYANQAEFIADKKLNQSEISGLLREKSFGSRKARNLEAKAGMPLRYLERTDDVSMSDSPTITPAFTKHNPSAGYVRIPLLNAPHGMGGALAPVDHPEILQYVEVTEEWARNML